MVRTEKQPRDGFYQPRVTALGIGRSCAYNGARPLIGLESDMTDDINNDNSDGSADAIAATAVISIVVFGLYLWLSGMPS